jgi:hypothetical protein
MHVIARWRRGRTLETLAMGQASSYAPIWQKPPYASQHARVSKSGRWGYMSTTHRAGAAEDGLGPLSDDAQVGDRHLRAGAEAATEGERLLLVEEDRLARHESERARQVVLVQMRHGAGGGGAEAGRRADKGLLEVAEPLLRADEAHVDPERKSADQNQRKEEEMPPEDGLYFFHKLLLLSGVKDAAVCFRRRWFLVIELSVNCMLLHLDWLRSLDNSFFEHRESRTHNNRRNHESNDHDRTSEVRKLAQILPDKTNS